MISTQEEIRMLVKIQHLQNDLDMCRWKHRELERDYLKQYEYYQNKLSKQFRKFVLFFILINIAYLFILI